MRTVTRLERKDGDEWRLLEVAAFEDVDEAREYVHGFTLMPDERFRVKVPGRKPVYVGNVR